MTDPHVEAVRRKLLQRSQAGIIKYGCTTDRDDLDILDWIRHAQEEAMDFSVYLECLSHKITRLGLLNGRVYF